MGMLGSRNSAVGRATLRNALWSRSRVDVFESPSPSGSFERGFRGVIENISILVVLLYSWRIGVNAKRYKELDDVYYGRLELKHGNKFARLTRERVTVNSGVFRSPPLRRVKQIGTNENVECTRRHRYPLWKWPRKQGLRKTGGGPSNFTLAVKQTGYCKEQQLEEHKLKMRLIQEKHAQELKFNEEKHNVELQILQLNKEKLQLELELLKTNREVELISKTRRVVARFEGVRRADSILNAALCGLSLINLLLFPRGTIKRRRSGIERGVGVVA
ncbi:hypothetical protein EVAR_2618_1 [Eumeta japonica]|uniref:Uncharacterized protein n=1 Tax=Eumeta variegata TaxID=151549 RepID=A0A4C1SMN0_EUMVA|nr:hypothetical protein EVAR_2618_1 [Eumeta japonica]